MNNLNIRNNNIQIVKMVIIMAVNKLESGNLNTQQVASTLSLAYLCHLGFLYVPEGTQELLSDSIALWERSNKTTKELFLMDELLDAIAKQISEANPAVELPPLKELEYSLIEQNRVSDEDFFGWAYNRIKNKIEYSQDVVRLEPESLTHRLKIFLPKIQTQQLLSDILCIME